MFSVAAVQYCLSDSVEETLTRIRPLIIAAVSGRAHWHVLLRARAIETGCFVVAPAQFGTHADGRQTYGHSLIINPWGEIIAEADDGDEVIAAMLDTKCG